MNNTELIERYPFLKKRDWLGHVIDTEYTWLDSMEKGWRKAFGMQMMEDLREALIATDFMDEFCILDIKEKFATLRFYCGAAPKEVIDVIRKYEDESHFFCQFCGEPSHIMEVNGWIYNVCSSCEEKLWRK